MATFADLSKPGPTPGTMASNLAGGKAQAGIDPQPSTSMNDITFGGEQVAFSDFFFNNYRIDGRDWAKTFGYSFTIYDYKTGVEKSFALPIAPTNISIDVPAASSVAVTMKGIVEEHNGAPLRRISIRGTSGMLPYGLPAPLAAGGPSGIASALFANTIQQAGRIVNDFNKVVGSVNSLIDGGSQRPELLNHNPTSRESGSPVQMNGYTFAHGLINFLDQYMAMKKQKKYKNVRFQFVMNKDKMYYDCTLNSYSIRKNPGTLEYEYDISLTAWRRSKERAGRVKRKAAVTQATAIKDLNALAKIMGTLKQSRKLINSSVGILMGIRSDIDQSFLGPLREVMMVGGELIGAAQSVINFPSTIVNSMKYGFEQGIINAKASTVGSNKVSELGQALKLQGAYATTGTVSSAIDYNQVDALDTLTTEKEGQQENSAEGSSPLDTIFNNQLLYQNVFDTFTVDELPLSPEVMTQVNAEIDRVTSLEIGDLIANQIKVNDYITSISNGLGGGSATYNRVNGLPTKSTYKKLRTEDIELLSNLNDLSMQLGSLIQYIKNLPNTSTTDYFEYYAEMARANGLTFDQSNSKFFVPFPYGASMESLAVQYLGDASRWIEIAALNGLKSPYIDEEGFIVPFKSSGSGTSALFTSSDNLYVGQIVEIMSDTQPTILRKINQIDILSSIEVFIGFDGNANLNQYTIADNARLKAFMPDTVNSLKLIAIPSLAPVSGDNQLKTSPGRDDLDFLAHMAKIDFLLTSEGDLAMTSSGEVRLATGLQNLVQAAQMKVQTKLGHIISDPQFGNPAEAGMSVADLNADQLLKLLNTAFEDDKRFSGVLAAKARITGGACEISLLIGIAQTDYHLPLTTQVPI